MFAYPVIELVSFSIQAKYKLANVYLGLQSFKIKVPKIGPSKEYANNLPF